jgi:hypothetical protein
MNLNNFTEEMVKKSLTVLKNNPEIEKKLISEIENKEFESKEEKASHILELFFAEDEIRPEILLEETDLAKKFLEDLEEIKAFVKKLNEYQYHEQLALSEEVNLMPEPEKLYPLNKAMKVDPTAIKSFSESLSTDDFELGEDLDLQKYDYNNDLVLEDVEVEDVEVKLDFYKKLEEAEMKTEAAIVKQIEEMNRKSYLDKQLENYLSKYEIRHQDLNEVNAEAGVDLPHKATYYSQGVSRMKVFKKAKNESPNYVSMSKDPQTKDLVTALLMVSPKNIASFPIDQDGKSINLLVSALAEIKEKDLFDLSELTVSANVDQRIHNLVAHAKNENVIAFGIENSPEKLIQEQQQKEVLKEQNRQAERQKQQAVQPEASSFTHPQEPMPSESVNDFEKYANQEQDFSIDDMDLEDSPLENSLSQSITKNTGIADEIGVFNKKVLEAEQNGEETNTVEKESEKPVQEVESQDSNQEMNRQAQEDLNEPSFEVDDDYPMPDFSIDDNEFDNMDFDNMEPPQFEQIPDDAYDHELMELPEGFDDDLGMPHFDDFNPDELQSEKPKSNNRPKNK